jgi:hypothetical protein
VRREENEELISALRRPTPAARAQQQAGRARRTAVRRPAGMIGGVGVVTCRVAAPALRLAAALPSPQLGDQTVGCGALFVLLCCEQKLHTEAWQHGVRAFATGRWLAAHGGGVCCCLLQRLSLRHALAPTTPESRPASCAGASAAFGRRGRCAVSTHCSRACETLANFALPRAACLRALAFAGVCSSPSACGRWRTGAAASASPRASSPVLLLLAALRRRRQNVWLDVRRLLASSHPPPSSHVPVPFPHRSPALSLSRAAYHTTRADPAVARFSLLSSSSLLCTPRSELATARPPHLDIPVPLP